MDQKKSGAKKKFNTPEEEQALILDHIYNFTPANLQEPATISQACAIARGDNLTYTDHLCPIKVEAIDITDCAHVEVRDGKPSFVPAKSNKD